MASDSASPILQLTLMATGNDNNTWGAIMNANLTAIENAYAGVTALTGQTGGTVNLTTSQRMNGVIDVRGTLSTNLILVDQVGTSMRWVVYNGCTLAGHTVSIKTTSGSSATITAGLHVVYTDGLNGMFVL